MVVVSWQYHEYVLCVVVCCGVLVCVGSLSGKQGDDWWVGAEDLP